jgi:WD40 repeat protein
LAVSSDGSTLAVAGDTPLIELWDLSRKTKKGVLAGHSADVTQLAFAPSGELLASASVDGQVRLWDVATRQPRVDVQVDEYGAFGLMFSSDGRTLVTNDAKGVRFWDTSHGHLVNQLERWRESSDRRSSTLSFLGFSDAGEDSILTRHEGRHGEVAAIINGATQVERFVFNPKRRLYIKLSPNGRAIVIGDRAGAVSILDATSGRPLVKAEGLKGEVLCLAFSPDGTLLAGGDDGERVRVWETNTGRLRTSFSSEEPIRRWGPTVTAILVAIATTVRLRRERGKLLPNRSAPYPGGAAA